MQPTALRVYFNFQSNKKFFRNYFSTRFVSGGGPLREVDLSPDLFQRPPTSPLSLMALASPLPLYFPHGASLSLTSSLYFLSQPLPSFSSYRCRFSVPFTRLISRYLLRVTFAHVAILPSSRTAILICSTKFTEKITLPSPDT